MHTHDSSLFIGQFFFNDGSQNFLTFQPGPTETMVAWQSKGSSNENIDLFTQQNIVFLQN